MSDRSLPVLEELHDKLLVSFTAAESPPRVRPRRRYAISAVAVAIACAIVAIVSLIDRPTGPIGVQEALGVVAAAVLEAEQPSGEQYVYERTINRYSERWGGGLVGVKSERVEPFSALFESTDEEWSNPLRCSYVHTVSARQLKSPTKLDAERAERWKKAAGNGAGSLPIHPAINGTIIGFPPQTSDRQPITLGAERLTAAELDDYPTDPKAIYRRIESSLRDARGSQSTANHVWNALELAPSNYGPARQLPPELHAGIVRAIGEIPGVEVVGEREMPTGDRAITFAREEAGLRYELTLAKDTGVKLESLVKIVTPQDGEMKGWPVGTIVRQQKVVERRLVDAVPQSVVKGYSEQKGIFPELECE